MKVKLSITLAFVCLIAIATPVQAQSGFKIDPIDPTVVVCNNNGSCTVYSVPGDLLLPSGTTVLFSGPSLSGALNAVADNLFANKGSQQSMLILRPKEQEASLTPHPPCPPTGPGNCKLDGPEPVPICWPWPCNNPVI